MGSPDGIEGVQLEGGRDRREKRVIDWIGNHALISRSPLNQLPIQSSDPPVRHGSHAMRGIQLDPPVCAYSFHAMTACGHISSKFDL